ncbi:MAG: DUF4959 domain-containing protein [Prolixibacteraceae bacterium]
MKKMYTYIVTMSLILILGHSCEEEGRLDHIDYSAAAPGQVHDITVKNNPGGATIKYSLPEDENLLYVKAEYEIRKGVVRESKASYYADSLTLDGFGDTRIYDVKIFSVGKNEKTSEPLIVQVNPQTAPVVLAAKELKSAFGGVSVTIENRYETDLAIVLMTDTAGTGYWNTLQTFYTSAARRTFSYRGLDTTPARFAAYVRDRWNNISDTIEATLTPRYEEFIPKNDWREIHLPTDTYDPIEGRAEYMLNRAFDGIINQANTMFATKTDAPMPQWATIDLGTTIIMSRLKVFHRSGAASGWTGANVKKFELYGSMNPSSDGSWDSSWISLGKFEASPPSGGVGPLITQADRDYASIEGIDFDLEANDFAPDPFVPIRYIRFKTTETCNGPSLSGSVWINELSFWGQIQE